MRYTSYTTDLAKLEKVDVEKKAKEIKKKFEKAYKKNGKNYAVDVQHKEEMFNVTKKKAVFIFQVNATEFDHKSILEEEFESVRDELENEIEENHLA